MVSPKLSVFNMYYSAIRDNSSKHIPSNHTPRGLELGWAEQGFPPEREQRKLRQLPADCFRSPGGLTVQVCLQSRCWEGRRWGAGARIGRPNIKIHKFVPGV